MRNIEICTLMCAGLLIASAPEAVARANGVAERPTDQRMALLLADIRQIAYSASGKAGEVGVSAWRLDGHGPRVMYNADRKFPMASTFKIAVAGALLDRVDQRKISLDDMIQINSDRMIESAVIAKNFMHPGLSISVYNLLELMLTLFPVSTYGTDLRL
jgi:beta-lactamase class A